AARVDRRVRDGIECRRTARAEIEDARALATIVKVEIRRDDVIDMDEVAPLLAIRISAGALEQAHAAIAPVLLEEVIRDRGHPSLVCLARPVDVEIAKACDRRGSLRQQ